MISHTVNDLAATGKRILVYTPTMGLHSVNASLVTLNSSRAMATMGMNPASTSGGEVNSRGRGDWWGKGLVRVVVRKHRRVVSVRVVANGVSDVVTQLQHGVPELVSYLPGAATEGLSNVSALAEHWDAESLRMAGTSAAGLLYLTAKPGVVTGALDTYVGAPFQAVIEFVRGRRSWKRTDFVVDERLGEGSFGTVFTGVILPRNVGAEDEELVGRRGRRLEEFENYKKFKKVILKKVQLRDSVQQILGFGIL